MNKDESQNKHVDWKKKDQKREHTILLHYIKSKNKQTNPYWQKAD